MLAPLVTAAIGGVYLREPMHDDGYNRTHGLRLILPPDLPLHFDEGYLVGMQVRCWHLCYV